MHRPTRPPRTALLLDALGTIVALAPPAPRLRAELAARFGLELTGEQAQRGLAAEISYYRAHLQDGRDAASLGALRHRCGEVLRDALPRSHRLAAIAPAELTEALLASLCFSPFPDALGALRAARARGERVVVLSNWDVSLRDVLGQFELSECLDGIVTSAEVGARKPAPAVFAAALALAGAEAGGATHVGDSLEEDVAGARATGIEAVLIRRSGEPGPTGVRTISNLAELDRPPA